MDLNDILLEKGCVLKSFLSVNGNRKCEIFITAIHQFKERSHYKASKEVRPRTPKQLTRLENKKVNN